MSNYESRQNFILAVTKLQNNEAQFLKGKVTPVEHSRVRENALSDALFYLAADMGVNLNKSKLNINSNGDFDFQGENALRGGDPFSKELCDFLNKHGVTRNGVDTSTASEMIPDQSNWTFINHFGAEKLVKERIVELGLSQNPEDLIYRARIVNGDYWSENDVVEVFRFSDVINAAEEFLMDSNQSGLGYDASDIELVGSNNVVITLDEAIDKHAMLTQPDYDLALPNKSYFGTIIKPPHDRVVIQSLGRGNSISHVADRLNKVPAVGDSVEIKYDADGHGVVESLEKSKIER